MHIFFTQYFKKQLKKLSKKFPHIKSDLISQLRVFDVENEISIGRSIYKIRIKNSDQNKGASSGYRSYVRLYRKNDLLVPLCIYSKNEKESITENELQMHVDKANEELIVYGL